MMVVRACVRACVRLGPNSLYVLAGGCQVFGEWRYPSEPIFVPKSQDAEEGEGYLVVLVCEF